MEDDRHEPAPLRQQMDDEPVEHEPVDGAPGDGAPGDPVTASRLPTLVLDPKPPARRWWQKRGWRFWGRWGLLAVTLSLLLFVLFQWLTWPDVDSLVEKNPETTAFIEHYRQRAAKAKLPEPRQRWVSSSRISAELRHAVLVSEDIDFFDHHGFAVEEMKIALREAWKEKEMPRGASTLTQQLVKNLWLSPSRNPWRKLKEALLTRQVEARLSKHRILEIYLNVVEFGPGIYGAEAASRHYFGKSAAELTQRESAALAAALPLPSRWHPGSGSSTAAHRQERILRRMAKSAWLRKSL